jgi:hypothetical protein
MSNRREQIEKLVDTYLNSGHIHKFPITNIVKEDISTYDGKYLLYKIKYDTTNSNLTNELWDEIVGGIKKYTNLKQGKDYWLGLEWSWNS